MFANVGPFSEPETALDHARIAEECGFESIWTVEHTVVPAGYESEYPYDASGRMPAGDDLAITDPFVWLTWVGAQTSTIRLATGIVILPQRNPITLAKEIATLDRLSGGRVVLGVGVGWLEEEFDALGVPFRERGARTDEYIEIMRALWTESPASYHGRFFDFTDCYCSPTPARAEGVPIVVGGHSPAAARRAGRLGDGFFPGRGGIDELTPLIEEMRRAATEHGRDADAIEITAGGPLDADGIKRLGDVGVDRVAVPMLGFDRESMKAGYGAFAENVIQKL